MSHIFTLFTFLNTFWNQRSGVCFTFLYVRGIIWIPLIPRPLLKHPPPPPLPPPAPLPPLLPLSTAHLRFSFLSAYFPYHSSLAPGILFFQLCSKDSWRCMQKISSKHYHISLSCFRSLRKIMNYRVRILCVPQILVDKLNSQ